MCVKHHVAIALMISSGLFMTACQKRPGAKALHAANVNHSTNSVVSSLRKKDLGVLPLSDHVSTTVSLGNNTQCTLTPTLLKGGNLQIILAMETTSINGKLQSVNVARVLTRPGEPFNVSIGDLNLAFTPQVDVQ
jgi:hypothetical protein